jgi:hypothetical protein
MKKYIVRMEASTIYSITVSAENKDQALEIGSAKLFEGEGQESVGSFSWGQWNDVEEKEVEND